MNLFKIRNPHGEVCGVFDAKDEEIALDIMAGKYGFDNYDELRKSAGDFTATALEHGSNRSIPEVTRLIVNYLCQMDLPVTVTSSTESESVYVYCASLKIRISDHDLPEHHDRRGGRFPDYEVFPNSSGHYAEWASVVASIAHTTDSRLPNHPSVQKAAATSNRLGQRTFPELVAEDRACKEAKARAHRNFRQLCEA